MCTLSTIPAGVLSLCICVRLGHQGGRPVGQAIQSYVGAGAVFGHLQAGQQQGDVSGSVGSLARASAGHVTRPSRQAQPY